MKQHLTIINLRLSRLGPVVITSAFGKSDLLRAASYEPGNRAEFCFLFIWEISAGDRDEIEETKTKWRHMHKLVSFAAIRALSTIVILTIKLIVILLNWKCIQDKFMPFWSPCCKREVN